MILATPYSTQLIATSNLKFTLIVGVVTSSLHVLLKGTVTGKPPKYSLRRGHFSKPFNLFDLTSKNIRKDTKCHGKPNSNPKSSKMRFLTLHEAAE